ncbi:uncharacterized protein [Dysidea avara]|uniref:uncharacterized protein isoform X2 n=1 Tax=Dysidea avara TaxID=196820 RepID=UPI00331BEA13
MSPQRPSSSASPPSSSRMSPRRPSRSTSPSSSKMSPQRPSRSASPLTSSRMSPQQACQSVPPLLPDKPLSNQIVSPIASPTDDTSSPPDHMESESQSKNSEKSYDHLTTCDRHKAIREAADLEYRKNAERMKLQTIE